MLNLISNAIKYTQEDGKVEYKVEQISEVKNGIVVYRLTVVDNGIGMSEEFQKHLFEAFSRENTATVSKKEGVGLGLTIVKKIVDLAGGTIKFQSKQNVGSTFIIEVPFKVMDEATEKAFKEKQKEDKTTENYDFRGRKILLVEDNEMNLDIVTEILERSGLIVDTAKDGTIAVKKVKEKGALYYDFILMDIQMPIMDGYEATAEIRKLPDGDKVSIIALSANAFKEDMEKSISAGMNAHVAKPIDVKILLKTMHKLTKN